MLDQETIEQQRALLDAHRRTLQHFLEQRARLGREYTPPGIASGIDDARRDIRRIKALLRRSNVAVDDRPDDEEPSAPLPNWSSAVFPHQPVSPPQMSVMPSPTVLEIYSRKRTKTLGELLGSVIGGVVGMVMLIHAARISLGLVSAGSTPASVFLFVALIVLAFSIGIGWEAYIDRDLRVLIFDDRLELHRRGAIAIYPWHRITKVWVDVTQSLVKIAGGYKTVVTPSQYIFAMDSGQSQMLDQSLHDLPDLERTIRHYVSLHLLPRYRTQLEAGQTISFGQGLALSRRGVRFGTTLIPIADIDYADYTATEITLRKLTDVDPLSMMLSKEIYNIFIFVELLNNMVGSRRQFTSTIRH